MRRGEPLLWEALVAVLGDHPGLKGAKEQGRGDPAQHAAHQQQRQRREVLDVLMMISSTQKSTQPIFRPYWST